MNLSPWPDWLDQTWAKSSIEEGQPGESLAQHTQLVLERLADLARLRPHLTTFLKAPRLWHCLFWACYFHDFGKAALGFQKMVKEKDVRWQQRHEVLSLAFLGWIAPSFSLEEQQWIVAAIASHHKDSKVITSIYDRDSSPELVEGMVSELNEITVSGLWRWLNECSTPWITALGFHVFGVQPVMLVEQEQALHMVCKEGAQRINAWLDIYEDSLDEFKKERHAHVISTLVMLRGLTTTADHSASAHLKQISPGIQRPWGKFAEAFKEELQRHKSEQDEEIKTYRHQSQCATQHHTSALLIAPTGSGKTEAALYWAMGNGTEPIPRVFYTLPYQASMNAMHLRLSLPHYFGAETVGLQHGRALQTLYKRQIDAETGPATATERSRWAINLNRLHAYPVKVFSPYQMLKIPYQIKGFEAMLTDYTQAAFIFDEIHAYDVHRLALILALVKHLRTHYDARFLIMSATLPSLLRKIMPDVLGTETTIVAEDTLFQRFRRHHLKMLDGDLLDKGIEYIITDVHQGKSVLVCCNTVQRTQEMHAALRRLLHPNQVALLHSRFTMEDRLKHEQDILSRCASGVKSEAIAVVATQVVEVSLNIDLDTIYSDPAPLDALIQRFGRVNRARKKKIVPVHVFREPSDGQGVYSPLLLQHTLNELEKHNDTDIDEAVVEQWLDAIYDTPEIHDPWNEAYHTQFANVEMLLRGLRPFNSDRQREEEFDALFDGVEVLPSTFLARYLDHINNKEFIEASQLFVPISYRKLHFLKSKGKIRSLVEDKEDKMSKQWVVTLPYDSEIGLYLDTFTNIPNDES